MKVSIIYLFLVLALLSSCTRYESFAGYEMDSFEGSINLVSSERHSTIEAELFALINEYRTSNGLNAMLFEPTTFYYSGQHTDYMINNGEVSHAKFGERAEKISKRTGAVYVAENVAKNYDTVEQAFEAWLKSPGHRKNIEGDYHYSAISIKPNSKGNLYFTQMFFR